MFKKLLVIIFLSSSSIFSQESLGLTQLEVNKIYESISAKNLRESTPNFITASQNAKLNSKTVNSLLFFKQKYIYLNKRIDEVAKLKDSLLLFSRDTESLKRENFNSYRKELSQLLSKEQFYSLYKPIIDPEIKLSLEDRIGKIKTNYTISSTQEKELKNLLLEYQKQICINNEYYIYNKNLAQLKEAEIEKLIKVKLQDNFTGIGLKENSFNYLNDPISKQFVEKAISIGLDKEKAIEICSEIHKLKSELEIAKNIGYVNDHSLLYTLDDRNYHSSQINKGIAQYISSVITIEEYEKLFWDQLEPKIQSSSLIELGRVMEKYDLEISDSEKDMLLKWVTIYVTKEIVANHYYGHESSLLKVKIALIQNEADKKYKEVLSKISKDPIAYAKTLDPRAKQFLENAQKQGVDTTKAKMILEACLDYELAQKEIMAKKKYENEYIYNLEIVDNKIQKRNSFRYFLNKNLTQEEYRKLFWDQLKPAIDKKTNIKVKKAQEVYGFDTEKKIELEQFLKVQTTKEVVTYQYYSYDKKLAKQKLKALNFKFQNEYKSKINALKQSKTQ